MSDEQDAVRYRWIRDALMDATGTSFALLFRVTTPDPKSAAHFDALVDVAMDTETRYTLTDAGRAAMEKKP